MCDHFYYSIVCFSIVFFRRQDFFSSIIFSLRWTLMIAIFSFSHLCSSLSNYHGSHKGLLSSPGSSEQSFFLYFLLFIVPPYCLVLFRCESFDNGFIWVRERILVFFGTDHLLLLLLGA